MTSPLKFWSKCEVAHAASHYNTRQDLKKNNEKAYQAAHHNGWIDDVCSHMLEPSIGRRVYWTFEMTKVEALKYRTREEFNRGSCGAYGAAKRNKWLPGVCGHMTDGLRSDHNAFYIWRVPHTDIYKIGVTSFRLGLQRVREVASKIAVVPELILFRHCASAVALETSALNITEKVTGLSGFTGASEFRKMSQQHLSELCAVAGVYR
jgi:hypothetical protein